MKKHLVVFVINILCFVLQTTIFQHLKFGNIAPNFLVILTAAFGLMYGRKIGMFSGVIGGLFMDCIFGGVIGINILIYSVIGYVNGMANKLYFKEDIYIPIISFVLSDISYGILYYIMIFLLRGRLDFPYYLFHIILPECIYTIIIGFFIYHFLFWLDERIYPEEEVELENRIEK